MTTYLIAIPYNDLAADRARVHVEPIAAASDSEARRHAEQLRADGRALMNPPVDDWQGIEELNRLDGSGLLAEYGIHLGDMELWQENRLVWCDQATPSPSPLLGGAR